MSGFFICFCFLERPGISHFAVPVAQVTGYCPAQELVSRHESRSFRKFLRSVENSVEGTSRSAGELRSFSYLPVLPRL